jgi:hypothetical protein
MKYHAQYENKATPATSINIPMAVRCGGGEIIGPFPSAAS